jgi:hypothetical protein
MSLTNAALAEQANFVQFAYNMYALGGLKPTADAGIDAAGYQFLYWLNAKDLGTPSFYGYLAASKSNPGNLVIAVRGTEDAKEWLLDFAAIPVLMEGIGFVALGFLSIFNTFVFVDSTGASLNLIDVITKLNSANPIQAVNVIGHSLGAEGRQLELCFAARWPARFRLALQRRRQNQLSCLELARHCS